MQYAARKEGRTNVDVEPRPLPVTGETWNNGRANTRNEAKVDIKPKGF